MNSIVLQGQQFSFTVIRKPIKTIRLRLLSRYSFTISCPTLTPDSLIRRFIAQQSGWIVRNASKLSTPPLPVSKEKLKQYKQQARHIILSELDSISRQYHFSFGHISVRDQKTRFGSCSQNGDLSFNWRIAFFPRDKFRHILFHELVHLTIKNHSPRFWAALSVYDPGWRQNRQWIRQNGSTIPI